MLAAIHDNRLVRRLERDDASAEPQAAEVVTCDRRWLLDELDAATQARAVS